jgi:hypothetical protein
LKYPIINSHNNWSKLEEVLLGDVYPTSWYDHLDPEIRDCFYKLTETTQEDLNTIQKKIESFGVTVRRPCYNHIDNYMVETPKGWVLEKPEITPRDFYLTAGNDLFAIKPWRLDGPWQTFINEYQQNSDCKVHEVLHATDIRLSGSNTVRCGRDIYFDLIFATDIQEDFEKLLDQFNTHFAPLFRDYRIHLLFNGGHIDGCFALLKPECILATGYYTGYNETFPGWHSVGTKNPEFMNDKQYLASRSRLHQNLPTFNGKWYLPGMSTNKSFNEHIIQHARDWVGDYTETYFEVNCLVIDEKNVVVCGENEEIFRALEQQGITAHSVPFRTRTFWDGGMHCLTLDIRRQSKIEDFFSERSNQTLFVHDDRHIKPFPDSKSKYNDNLKT